MSDNFIQILINGGLASVALVALWILYKINSNHLHHLEKSNELFAGALKELSNSIRYLSNKL